MKKQTVYDSSSPVSDKEDNIAIEENDEQSLLPSTNQPKTQLPKDAHYYEILNQNENQLNDQYPDNPLYNENNYTESNEPQNLNIIKTPSSKHDPSSFRNFISLSSLSKCQQCNNSFDNTNHLPFLLKCGHFFCKTCILTYFTTETGISCPIDGPAASSLHELTILDKLITSDSIQQDYYYNNNNTIHISNKDVYCKVHKDQKLTHIVEETRELICVYCAINRMKSGNKIDVKEISEKCKEYVEDVDVIIENHRRLNDILQHIQENCISNKENAVNKVNAVYNMLIQYLIENKNTLLMKINELSNENESNLKQKQNYVKYKIHNGNALKKELETISNSADKFNEVSDKYNLFVRDSNDNVHQEIIVNEFNYAHCDENKILKYLSEFGDLKSKKKTHVNNYGNNNPHNTIVATTSIPNKKGFKESNINNENHYRGHKKEHNVQKIIKNYYTTGMKNEITESGIMQSVNTNESNSIGGVSVVNTNANNTNSNNVNNRNSHKNKHKHHQKQMKTVNVENIKRPNVKEYDNIDEDCDDFINNNIYNANERIAILEKYTFTPKNDQNIYNTHKKHP